MLFVQGGAVAFETFFQTLRQSHERLLQVLESYQLASIVNSLVHSELCKTVSRQIGTCVDILVSVPLSRLSCLAIS
jgi:hypothetical protein